jgi:hypothetical protein
MQLDEDFDEYRMSASRKASSALSI